jgi:hypothetical protein
LTASGRTYNPRFVASTIRRRTLFQSAVALIVTRPWARVRALVQASILTERDIATLQAIGEVVLPAAIGAGGRKAAVDKFVRWVRNYREGADRGHGYGASTLSTPSGPSPAARYPAQFAALAQAAATRGAASFAALPLNARRAVVEDALNLPSPVARFPARPTGLNLVADFMGFYFNSPEAYDHCYQRDIGKDACRSLAGSENLPGRRSGGDEPAGLKTGRSNTRTD